MGKKFFGILVLVALLMVVLPVQAQVWGGGAFSIGIRENADHAGLNNFAGEFYYTDDDTKPLDDAVPFAVLQGSEERPSFPNHFPGYEGKLWFLLKASILNAGEIKAVQLSFVDRKKQVIVDANLTDTQADFWMDMSRFKGGSYPMKLKVTHMGGEVTYHFLFFLFRSKKSVTDETVETLTIYEPDFAYRMAEVDGMRLIRGAEPISGAKAFSLNTGGKDMPVRLAPPRPKVASSSSETPSNYGGPPQAQWGTVVIDIYRDPMLVVRSTARFDLKSEQGRVISGQTGDRITFTVPPGKYTLIGQHGWEIRNYRGPITVTAGESQTVNVFKKEKEGGKRS